MLRIEISEIFLIIKNLELKIDAFFNRKKMEIKYNLIYVLIKESFIKNNFLIYEANYFTHVIKKITCTISTSDFLESEFVINFYFSFEYKPSGLIGYSIGPHGAAVACAAARPFLSELGCLPVKHVATVGQVRLLFKFNCSSTKNKIKTLH